MAARLAEDEREADAARRAALAADLAALALADAAREAPRAAAFLAVMARARPAARARLAARAAPPVRERDLREERERVAIYIYTKYFFNSS